ncbi:hypothetical protein [Sphingobium sp. MK2]|uniref:hypothetical protein n=1 Tax=Sphingobium sp. MK2 TaxID=3116540 RepID=UPI0032E3635A
MMQELSLATTGALKPLADFQQKARVMTAEKVSREEVVAFRVRHGLRQEDLGFLLGHKSKDRGVRIWEEEHGSGAPYYVRIIFAYVDRYGLDVLKELAAQ